MDAPPLRILTILEAHSVTGPAKAVLEFHRESVKSDAAHRIELSVLTFSRGGENDFTRAIRAEGLPLDILPEKGRFDTGVIPKLREAVARRRPDIIWTNAVKSHFLIRASGLNRAAKWVAFHHGYTATHWSTRLYNQLDWWSHRGADRLVTVCEPFASQLSARGIPRQLIHVEHMPIRPSPPVPNDESAALRRELGIGSEELVILSVGRLSKEKGHVDLLRALSTPERIKAPRPVRLVLVGDGPEAAALKSLSEQLHLSDLVVFAGHRTDVRRFYALADVFVLPSHTEGSPNVLLEAIDAGVPIVATAVGGIPEIVIDEVTALLVKAKDSDALRGAMSRLISSETLCLSLAEAARPTLRRHSPGSYFNHLSAVFLEVAGRAGVSPPFLD